MCLKNWFDLLLPCEHPTTKLINTSKGQSRAKQYILINHDIKADKQWGECLWTYLIMRHSLHRL